MHETVHQVQVAGLDLMTGSLAVGYFEGSGETVGREPTSLKRHPLQPQQSFISSPSFNVPLGSSRLKSCRKET
ncbi:hypothetical protein PGT21_000347 [Puccinia graminis f. sp. tritici]|uniref:Uncharacterized protein n=1 Tax=Puccinia graminis f. sp. tritici TaxID=56615 RepID=A0A5B0RK58_PUCGR|nr:hypothetical protein PGT21_034162 [Puccinia graminis f. sp. tritici]KAA1081752.1 hypothetical protein PGT21_000347 [Puccinia graminis f. sp. tritici]KAA1125385.1 hypothetical protein PGTUg99_017630 [Puccinia graminis f. sp. tritici]